MTPRKKKKIRTKTGAANMSKNNKEEKGFMLVYQNQCVNCYVEGTYKCELDVDKETHKCRNFIPIF